MLPFFIVNWVEIHNTFFTVAGTIAIAVFTWALVRATYKLWKASQDQSQDMKASLAIAKDSADAAKKTADSFQAIERDRLFVKVQRDPPPKQGQIIESIKEGYNRARIIAILTKINWHIGVMNDNEIDGKINELMSSSTQFPDGVITISKNSTKEIPSDCHIAASDFQRIDEPTICYVCLGYIRYKDVFRKIRQTVFCWKDNGIYFVPDPERNDRKPPPLSEMGIKERTFECFINYSLKGRENKE